MRFKDIRANLARRLLNDPAAGPYIPRAKLERWIQAATIPDAIQLARIAKAEAKRKRRAQRRNPPNVRIE